VVATFASHGWLAFTLKSKWFAYLATVGITGDAAITVMKAIGIVDGLVALITAIKPLPSVLVWAVFWAFLTALIRPLSGEPWVEFFERMVNWVCPLALLLIIKNKQ
jgi:hypothetical protein